MTYVDYTKLFYPTTLSEAVVDQNAVVFSAIDQLIEHRNLGLDITEDMQTTHQELVKLFAIN